MAMKVVLPAPLRPSRPVIVSFLTENDTLSKARTSPWVRVKFLTVIAVFMVIPFGFRGRWCWAGAAGAAT